MIKAIKKAICRYQGHQWVGRLFTDRPDRDYSECTQCGKTGPITMVFPKGYGSEGGDVN